MSGKARLLLLVPALLLAACQQASPATDLSSVPGVQAPALGQTKPLGLYQMDLTVQPGGAVSIGPVKALQGQYITGLSFAASAATVVSVGQETHLTITATMQNNTGRALTAPTIVPISRGGTSPTVAGTPFASPKAADGRDLTTLPGTWFQQAVVSGSAPRRSSVATPLVGPLDTSGLSFAASDNVTGVFRHGWKSGPLAVGGSQAVDLSVMSTNALTPPSDIPYRLSLIFAVYDDLPLANRGSAMISEINAGDRILVEFYNGSASTIAANQLVYRSYRPGQSTPEIVYLVPKALAPGETFVYTTDTRAGINIARLKANDAVPSPQTDSVAGLSWGIGAHTLSLGGTVIDSVGAVGTFTRWGADNVSVRTVRRKDSVTSGSPTYMASQWEDLVFSSNNYGFRSGQLSSAGVATNAVSGTIFDDLNQNSVRESGESGLKDWTVYADLNRNGVLNIGEPSVQTDAAGNYSLSGLQGTVQVGVQTRLGYAATTRVVGTTQQTVMPQIINGQEATADTAPFQVSVQVYASAGATSFGHCGGSVIAPRWILTAAHCFSASTTPNLVKVVYGTLNNSDGSGTTVTASNLVLHPQYNASTYDNDIALIYLGSQAVPGDITPILPASPLERALNAPGTKVRVSGWGKTEAGTSPDRLRYVDQELSDNALCQSSWNSTGNMVCAQTPAGDTTVRESCQGDSGGPLFTRTGPLRQVGVVSFGTPSCQEIAKPGVYVRLTEYDTWLSQQTQRGADTVASVNLTTPVSGLNFAARQSSLR